jgi:DNA (cytosine-5)-methyltransferase 1
MTPREYARLQGAPDYHLDGVSDNQARFGFGDAVCVPVVEWLAREYLKPLVRQLPHAGIASAG